MIQPPPKMVDQIYRWARAQMAAGRAVGDMNTIEATKQDIQRHVQLLKEAYQNNDEEAIEYETDRLVTLEGYLKHDEDKLEETLKEVKLFPRVRVKRWNRVKRLFKVDMRGWKYQSLLRNAEQKNIDYANELWGKITVELVKGDINRKAKAYWRASTATLRIKTGGDLRHVIEHELVHWAQSYLNIALWIKGFGRPSKKIQTPEYEQHMKVPAQLSRKLGEMGLEEGAIHDLDDVEFYTELGDAYDHFLGLIKEPALAGISTAEVLKRYVGFKGKPQNLFFQRLKSGAPDKWKKAVKEITKAVL